MITRRDLFKKFALSLFALFVLNALASYFHWYQSFARFDQFMHAFGGLCGGLFLIWFFHEKYSFWRGEKRFLTIILVNSFLLLVAASLWEVMEYSMQDLFDIGNVLAERNDSINDLFCGLMGNFIALGYYFSKDNHGK